MTRVPSQNIPIGTNPKVLKYVMRIAMAEMRKKLAAARNGR
jgi:hypothetical protein